MLLAHPPMHQAHAAASRLESAVVRVVNRTRAAYGLPRLHFNGALTLVAREHSTDLAVHDFLSHDGSDGTSFASRMRQVTSARDVGETIVEMPGHVTAQGIVQAWLGSPPHRAELLSPLYHRVGVGRARNGAMTFVTADFAS